MRKGIAALGLGLFVLTGILVATAGAAQEELLAEARKLVEESKPLVEQANDVDAKMEDRKSPRKEAFQKLKHARDLFDKYVDANPGSEDKLDKEIVACFSLIYWLKKESSLGDLDDKDAPPAELPQGGAPTSPSGGDKSPGVQPPATQGAGPVDPPVDTKKLSPSDFAFAAKKQFDAVEVYEKQHPADLPLLKQFYERFLSDFSDPSLPEYGKAVEKLGKINDRMKTVLKEVAKRDPDTISGSDSKEEKTIFGKLTSDFTAKDIDVRRRATQLMAASRARGATYFLARALSDKDDEIAKICHDGLIAMGGTYVGENLVKLYRDASKEKQVDAMDVLNEITKKGPVDAAAESGWIGHFVLSNESDVAVQAINVLKSMGKAGGPGLMRGLDSKFVEKKIDCIHALTDVKYYRCAKTIGERWLGTKVPRALHDESLKALETMGVYVVPYLIPSMGEAYCPWVLSKITGESFILGETKKARAWWNANKPKDAEDP